MAFCTHFGELETSNKIKLSNTDLLPYSDLSIGWSLGFILYFIGLMCLLTLQSQKMHENFRLLRMEIFFRVKWIITKNNKRLNILILILIFFKVFYLLSPLSLSSVVVSAQWQEQGLQELCFL